MSDSFFERWSRRKQLVREGEVPPPEPPPTVADEALPSEQPAPAAVAKSETPDAAPAPTLADTEALTPASDFKPFVERNVAPEVRNAAMKKLFADPHFNVMDRMDVYIDDYSQSVPMPASVLRQLASAAFMKLVDDEDQDKSRETPDVKSVNNVAQSLHPGTEPSPPAAHEQPASQNTDDHDADLRLQQDDATRAEDPRRGAG